MARMYETYKLKITNDEGIKDVRVNKNVDCTSYKQMINFYKECKKRNENNSCTIDFIGVTATGEENIMFSKTYCQELNQDKELLRSTDSIVGEIKHLLGLLDRKKEYHDQLQSVLDKKKNIQLHKIETIKEFKGTKEELIREKIKIFDSIELISQERRFHKEEWSKLKVLRKVINLDSIIDQFEKVIIPIDERDYQYLSNEIIEEKKIFKEYTYRSDKERLRIMKQIEGKYSKVINDSVNNKLVCYNLANNKNKLNK